MLKNIKKLFAAAISSVVLMTVPAFAFTGTVTADLLNIRTAPSTDSYAVGTLSWGDTVTVTYDCGGNWYEIYANGGCYYVNSSYVSGGSGSSSSSSSASYSNESYDANSGSTASDTSNGTYLGNFALTAYCACSSCCGNSTGITASGTTPVAGRTVAMGGVPFGTKLLINGNVYTVEDRGTAYGTVDIYCSTHAEASAFGLQYADVYQVY